MAEGTRSPMTIVLWVFGISGVLCCCGGGVATLLSPQILVAMMTDSEPLDLPPVVPDPAMCEAKDLELLETGRTTMTGPEATVCLYPEDGDLAAWRLEAVGDEAMADVSVYDAANDHYINLHVRGVMEIQDGWFTRFEISELSAGSFELGGILAGQDMAGDVNGSLAEQRTADPEMAAMLDEIQLLTVDDGVFVLERTTAAPTP